MASNGATAPSEQLLAAIEAAIAANLPTHATAPGAQPLWQQRGGASADLQDDGAVLEIEAPARDLVARGGKRWRPLLLVLACRLCGGDPRAAVSLAPIVELAHTGSLIIDDIEDGAELRRGQPAVHLRHGLDLAVNAGNLLYFLPASTIAAAQLAPDQELEVYRHYGRALQRLHYGQGLDILWHRDPHRVPAVDAYLTMCRFKSGSMSGLAAQLGATVAGAGAELGRFLAQAGEDFGVCFQIIDDVKNLTTGNPGKHRGDDLVEGKKSLPVILLCEQDAAAGRRFASLLQQIAVAAADGAEATVAPVEAAIALLEAAGTIEQARERAVRRYRATAAALAERTDYAEPAALQQLLALTDALID